MSEPDRTARRVAAAARGDREAWEEVYDEIFPPVWRYVAARTGGRRPEVEDVVQDSLLALVRALPRYREEGRFFGFVFAVVRQRIAAWHRSRGREPGAVPAEVSDLPSREELPPDAAAAGERQELVRRALLTLSPRHRRALVLKYGEGVRFPDLGDRLGISEGAAKSLVIRAKDALRNALVAESDSETGGTR